jgi:hypothetical protein
MALLKFMLQSTSQQKVAAIRRSNYLNTVYQSVIPSLQGILTIYGWSMSEADDHILKALRGERINEVAIGVYKTGGHGEAKTQRMKHKIETSLGGKTKVWFFDSRNLISAEKS